MPPPRIVENDDLSDRLIQQISTNATPGEIAKAQQLAASIKLDDRSSQRMMEKKNIGDEVLNRFMEAGGTERLDANIVALPADFTPTRRKNEKWTYQLLAEDESIREFADDLLQECRATQLSAFKTSAPKVAIEWCFVFDNSGSMTRIRDACAETTVMLMEMLRRMETRFSIATSANS